MKELEVKERKRKPNFSPLEISVITESVKKNIDVIQSKLTNNITNKKKSQVWEEITKEVNALFPGLFTVPLMRMTDLLSRLKNF